MREPELARQIEQSRRRLERLRRSASHSGEADASFGEALEELGQTLEELSIAAEELTSTNEELAEAQLEVERQARRYLDLFRFAPEPYVVTDARGVIREMNAVAEEKLGRARRYLIGKPLLTQVAEGDRDRFLGFLAALRERRLRLSDQPLRFEGRRGFDASVSAAAEPREEGLEIRWMLRDVSERLRLESQLRAAATAAVVAEDRERRRLASDLHDDVGQLLTLAGMKLGTLAGEPGSDGRRKARLREVAELVNRAHERTESLTFQLSPPVLRDLGLGAAAEWLAEEMGRSYGLRVSVAGEAPTPLDEELRITLFRGLRELLINVARHADTDEARVFLTEEGAVLTVAVSDGGTGFDEGSIDAGFGLLSLRDRLKGLGGRLEIDSRAGRGARVRMVVPIRAAGSPGTEH